MSEFKEFHGKDMDEAIEAACDYYNLNRDKLEIEIIRGGSAGIFGLVGVKKATIKARPRGNMSQPEQDGDSKPERKAANRRPRPAKKEREHQQPKRRQAEDRIDERIEEQIEGQEQDALPDPEMAKLDPDQLTATVQEVMERLLAPIVPEPRIKVTLNPERVNVFIDDDEYSGLIIGREGQTLASLQYLANRLVSRKMQASVRVQIDTGDYRERQDEKLRQLANHLADKAEDTGRTQSTKPMSSYHRRIVHLALQNDGGVFTRSKGDGPLKRVLIVPKRKMANGRR